MEFAFALLLLILLVLLGVWNIRTVTIFESQRGLLYRQGKFVRVLEPGGYVYWRHFDSVQRVDMREMNITIPGQEVLTADNISLRISLAVAYRVVDPYKAMNAVASYPEALYQLVQIHLRDVIGSLEVDDLLARRNELGQQVLERAMGLAAELGLELKLASIKDIMFPGELKTMFAQVVNARKEGLAALERARGESAALRNLANAARMLEGNPNLRQLRLLQTLESHTGNTVVFLPENGLPGVQKAE